MDLKIKAVTAALQRDHDLYHNTANAHHAWHAWQLARQAGVAMPEWVLRFVDSIATRGVAERSRHTDTADRYEAALTAMDAAVERHRRRLKIRNVGKQLGVDIPISRRDRPNLTAIARAVAKEQRDTTKFDVTIHGTRHAQLPTRKVMLLLIRHLIDEGVSPEHIAAAVPSRSERRFRSADGTLDRAAFIESVTAQMRAQGRPFDPDRYFCETDDLIHVAGRTYALTNQWGATTHATIDALLTAFGSHGVTITDA